MEIQWFYSREGHVRGPVDGEELTRLAAAGELSATDFVWREGMTEWVPAGTIGLGTRAAATPPPLPAEASAPPAPPPPPTLAPPPAPTPPIKAAPAGVEAPFKRQPASNRGPLILGWVLGTVTALVIATAFYFASSPRQPVAKADAAKTAQPPAPASPRVTPAPAPTSPAAGTRPPVAATAPTPELLAPAPPPSIPPAAAPAPAATPEPSRPAPRDGKATGSGKATASDTPVPQPEPAPAPPTTPPPPAPQLPTAPEPTQQPGQFQQQSHRLYQEIDIHRRPNFVLQGGLNVAQDIRYRVLSRLQLGEVGADGKREVTQYVEDTRLVAADELSRAAFASSLAALRGQQFIFTLNRFHEVVDFRGHKDNRKALPVKMPDNKGMMVTSVIDRDGWKELAELTFFKPSEELDEGRPWKRQMTHDWGSLGGWSGVTTFLPNSQRDAGNGRQYRFAHEITYAPPKAGAAPLAMGMQINGAEFRPVETGGQIQFDSQRERVDFVQEIFAVQGALSVELLGQPVQIQLTERQVIGIRLQDNKPWQQ